MAHVAFQCDECGENWPHVRKYAICPRCRTRCRSCLVDDILNAGEAQWKAKEAQFLREYRLREEKNARLGKMTPEQIGRAEAAEWYKIVKCFKSS